MIDSKININDVKKNLLFVNNKNIINERPKEEEYTTQKQLTSDINSIEKIRYKKLQLLLLEAKEKNERKNLKTEEDAMVLSRKIGGDKKWIRKN